MTIQPTQYSQDFKNKNIDTLSKQEALSEAFYQHYDKTHTKGENSSDVKLNIFTGEFYNLNETYNSTDEFKKDITSKEAKNLMDKLKNDSTSGGIIVLGEIQQNLADYYYNLDIKASFDLSGQHSDANLTAEQINSIDFELFFAKMLSEFKDELNQAKGTQSDKVIQQYQDIVDGYEFLNKAYSDISQKEQENKTLLAQYTKDTKQQAIIRDN